MACGFPKLPRRKFLWLAGFAAPARAYAIEGSSSVENQPGEFLLLPCLTLYIDVGDNNCKVLLDISTVNHSLNDLQTIRHFSPNEELLSRKNYEYFAAVEGSHPVDNLLEFELFEPGIHQFRMLSGTQNGKVRIGITKCLAWAISSHNGAFCPQDDASKAYWIYKPEGVESIVCRAARLETLSKTYLASQPDMQVVSFSPSSSAKLEHYSISRTEQIWYANLNGKDFRAHVAGWPVLWCDTREAALRFKASTEALPDRSLVHHKFQLEIYDLLQSMLQTTDFGSADTLKAELYRPSTHWLDNPERNYYLLSRYGPWPLALEALNFYDFERDSHSLLALDSEEDLGPSYADALASVATIDAPFNRLYQSQQIINRAVFASLRNLMLLDEGEYWGSAGKGAAAHNPYPGFMAFAVARHGFPEFAKLAPYVSQRIYNLWQSGLQRLLDRHAPMYMVSSRNQSAHYLVAWAMYAKGTRRKTDAEIARRVAGRYFDSVMPAGYQIEAYGPDATYAGMQHWHIALYYHLTQDPRALESIKKSYRFFNHTVVPLADGSMTGASDFSHRTGGSFDKEQWGGAKMMLGASLSDIGMWRVAVPSKLENKALRSLDIENALQRPPEKPYPINIHGPIYEHYQDAPGSGQAMSLWPALQRDESYSVLGNELVCVNRVHYYATIYVGRPSKFSDQPGILAMRRLLENTAIDQRLSKDFIIKQTNGTAFSCGGLSILWSPDSGAMVIGKNWSPLTVHTVLVVDSSGGVSWADYAKTVWDWVEPGTILKVSGETFGSGVLWSRQYAFGNKDILVSVEVSLSAGTSTDIVSVYENLPYLGWAYPQEKSLKPFRPVVLDSEVPNQFVEHRHKVDGLSAGLLRYEYDCSPKRAIQGDFKKQFRYSLRIPQG